MEGVLAGFRVLDFGRYIAGPYCAALLGDLGADVIRIERRGGGEDRWVAPVAPDGVGAMFLVMNRNKRAHDARSRCPRGPRDRQASSSRPPTWSSPTCRREALRSLASTSTSLRRSSPTSS